MLSNKQPLAVVCLQLVHDLYSILLYHQQQLAFIAPRPLHPQHNMMYVRNKTQSQTSNGDKSILDDLVPRAAIQCWHAKQLGGFMLLLLFLQKQPRGSEPASTVSYINSPSQYKAGIPSAYLNTSGVLAGRQRSGSGAKGCMTW